MPKPGVPVRALVRSPAVRMLTYKLAVAAGHDSQITRFLATASATDVRFGTVHSTADIAWFDFLGSVNTTDTRTCSLPIAILS